MEERYNCKFCIVPWYFCVFNKSDSAKYRVRFSIVGALKGNYIQITSTANGKVYKWVAPIAGVPQGNYEPLIPLVTPKQHQMATGGFEYTFNANHNLVMEGVFTKNDINTFSPHDSYNDQGYGYKLKSLNKSYLQKDTNDKVPVKMIYNLNYEYLQQNFTQVERFRSIEFQRDWNRPYVDAINTDQHIGSVEVELKKQTVTA
ncbi:MAG: hypothetical protein IPJ32_15060 [Sphingobacteriaceae bacterium]|nr:hypothetical protein [Sphingobacteriaceae bacterium]